MNDRRILPFQGWRLILFQAVVIFSLVVLIIRMADLQFVRGAQFQTDAEENRLQLVLKPAPRGAILDRYGVPLAKNDPAYNVAITPAYLPDDPADVLDLPSCDAISSRRFLFASSSFFCAAFTRSLMRFVCSEVATTC